MSYTFTYNDLNDVEVTMRVPERSAEEMCEYFQRFLAAAGYLFENNERISCVPTKARESPYPTIAADILSFNDNGTPFCYDFGAAQPVPVPFFGGAGEDFINLS